MQTVLQNQVAHSCSPGGGNSNCVFYSPGTNGNVCQPIVDLTVTINITQDLVSNVGFSFQLNGAGPPVAYQGFEQYGLTVSSPALCVQCSGTTLWGWVEPWAGAEAGGHVSDAIIWSTPSNSQPSLYRPYLPAGTVLQFALQNDSNGNVNQVTFTATGPSGSFQLQETEKMATLLKQNGEDTSNGNPSLSPLYAFQVDLVGPINGLTSYLSTGAGTISYSTSPSTPLMAALTEPGGCTSAAPGQTATSTLENSNSTYALVLPGPSSSFQQTFGAGALTPYLPGGPITAINSYAQNAVFANAVNAQLVNFTVSSGGQWSQGSAMQAAKPTSWTNDLRSLTSSALDGGAPEVFLIDQYGAVDLYASSAGGWTSGQIQPTAGLNRTGASFGVSPDYSASGVANIYSILNSYGPNNNDDGISLSSGTAAELLSTGNLSGSAAAAALSSIGPSNLDTDSAPLAAVQRNGVAGQTDVFVTDKNGVIHGYSQTGTGSWQAQPKISAPALNAGAPLAAAPQIGTNLTDVFAVSSSGNIVMNQAVGASAWSPAATIDGSGSFPATTWLAASQHFGAPHRTDLFAVNNSSTLVVYWVDSGGKWNGPQNVSATGQIPPGAHVFAMADGGNPSQTDVFVINSQGQPSMYWSNDAIGSSGGPATWNGPGILAEPCAPGYVVDAQGGCALACDSSHTMNSTGECVCPATFVAAPNGQCFCPTGYAQGTGGACNACAATYVMTAYGQCACPTGYAAGAGGACNVCAYGYVMSSGACVLQSSIVSSGTNPTCYGTCPAGMHFDPQTCLCAGGSLVNDKYPSQ